MKRKLGTSKLDPNFIDLKETIQQIIEDIRKSNPSLLKKSPFELQFGRKPNTKWSQALYNVVQPDTSAQGLQRNLLLPDQIASQDYSRDCAKVVPRGSASPTVAPRFKPMFSLDGNVNPTRRWLNSPGRQTSGRSLSAISHRMVENGSSEN